MTDTDYEVLALQRELRDLDEAIADAADNAAASRLRLQRGAMLRRMQEIEEGLVT